MKKYLLILFASLFYIGLSAQTTKKYTLTYDNLEEIHVKSLIKITGSLFLSPVEFVNDDYHVMVYRTSKTITKEETERILRKNGFKLSSFKSEEDK